MNLCIIIGKYINLSAIVLSLKKGSKIHIAETPLKYFGKYGLKLLSKRDRERKERGRENRKKDRERGRAYYIYIFIPGHLRGVHTLQKIKYSIFQNRHGSYGIRQWAIIGYTYPMTINKILKNWNHQIRIL